MGKPGEAQGDSLLEFAVNLSAEQRAAFLVDPLGKAAALVGSASSRIVYDLDRYRRERQPVFAAVLSRETHASDPTPATGLRVQLSLSYTDGFGREVQRKVPAEPGPLIANGPVISSRWLGSGWTVFNNKGKPVRKFEPFFDATHAFRFDQRVGVSSTLFYDPAERIVATLHPNHTWEKVVFDPWRRAIWDVNDTSLIARPQDDADVGSFFQRLAEADYLPTWYAARIDGGLGVAEQSAAAKTASHAATPAVVHTDVLGRTFLTVAQNRAEKNGQTHDVFLASRVVYDVEGKEREVSDANDRVVMRYDYDVLSNRVHQASMEAGERWVLSDVGGRPVFAWDSRGHRFRNTYDALHRPADTFLQQGGDAEQLIGHTEFGESVANPEAVNLRGKTYRHFDQSGLTGSEAYDFKGNLLTARRQLAADYKSTIDWLNAPALQAETFVSHTTYDALNRAVASTEPDGSVTRRQFNIAGLLEKIDVQPHGAAAPIQLVANIERDARGQRANILYGNGVRTSSTYDALTFRLLRRQTLRGKDGLQDMNYVYDPIGNITSIRDDAQQTLFFKNQVVIPSADYGYDAVYRLLSASGREHFGKQAVRAPTWNDDFRVHLPQPGDGQAMERYSEQYSYDDAGNILKVLHQVAGGNWQRTYSYREASLLEPNQVSNRLSGVATDMHKAKIYPYDEHGNMTAMPHLPNMSWDFHDRLRHVKLDSQNTAYYVYGADGRRVRRVVEKNGGALLEDHLTLGGFEVFRHRKAGGKLTLERQTLHVMDDRERIAMVETRTHGGERNVPRQAIRYQLGNHLGSATLELDDGGKIISYEEYYPYGGTSYQAGRNIAEVSLKRYRYAGMERDEETGLNYHGARYYAPWLGRWTSADPASLIDGANLYAMARNNPVQFVDLSGMDNTETTVVTPRVRADLEAANIQYAEQVTFDLLNAKGEIVSRGRFDVVFRDPRPSAGARLQILELKGKNINELHTNQHDYLPELEARGGTIRITSQKGGTLSLAKNQLVGVRPDDVVRVGTSNLEDFSGALREVAGGKPITNVWRGKNGEVKLFTSEAEAHEFYRSQGIDPARAARTKAVAAPKPVTSNSTQAEVGVPRAAVKPSGPIEEPPPVKLFGGMPGNGATVLDPAPGPKGTGIAIVATIGPPLAEHVARKLGASDRAVAQVGLLSSMGVGALLGAAAGAPEGGIGAAPGALIGGIIGGAGYLNRYYELCVPFYNCD